MANSVSKVGAFAVADLLMASTDMRLSGCALQTQQLHLPSVLAPANVYIPSK